MAYYGQTNTIQEMDQDKLGELHMRLNVLLSQPLKKLKQKEKNNLKTQGQQDVLVEGKAIWTTPKMLIIFLQNTIESCTPAVDVVPTSPLLSATPGNQNNGAVQEELKLRLAVWPEFKQLIYEIFDHRIEHAPEINGMINNSYMSMEEHLIIFFTQKYRTRHQIERRIIEFLASLKYFVDFWQRAKQYATLVGFLQADESFVRKSGTSETRPPMRLNDGK